MGLTALLSWCRGDELESLKAQSVLGPPPPPGSARWEAVGLQLGSEAGVQEGMGVPWVGNPARPLWCVSPPAGRPTTRQSQAAGDPELPERLTDTAGPAAGRDVLYPLPLAPGLLPAALPPAGRQQTLMRASANKRDRTLAVGWHSPSFLFLPILDGALLQIVEDSKET